jgi:hypothetical protein
MDGYTLKRELRQVISEPSDSDWVDSMWAYDTLHKAACEVVRRTECVLTSSTITTVASQVAYDMPVDYMNLFLKNDQNEFYVKMNDGTNNYFITWRDYSGVVSANQSVAVTIPDHFTIRGKATIAANVTGTASASSAVSGGECTLNVAAPISVNVGDTVHNVTDGSHGYVLSATSTTAYVTALFDGTDNDWTNGDTFVIVPQSRYEFLLDPAPKTSGYVVTLEYVQRPLPIYSLYRSYRIPMAYKDAVVQYAAWLHKYRDREPNFGDMFYKHFDMLCRSAGNATNKSLNRGDFKVNFRKSANASGTVR